VKKRRVERKRVKDKELDVNDLWSVMEAFYKEYGLVRQHLDSYNRFIDYLLPEIIRDFKRIQINENTVVEIKDYSIGEVPLAKDVDVGEKEVTPIKCRLRNLTYSVPLYIEVSISNLPKTYKFKLADIPVMLKSKIDPLSKLSDEELVKLGEDPKDPGGYFIINGSERIVVAQEELASNNILVDKVEEGSAVTHVAKVISTAKGRRSQLIIERRKDGIFYANLRGIRIPAVILMAALGLTSEADITTAVSLDPEVQSYLLPSILQAQPLFPKIEPGEEVDEKELRRKCIEAMLEFIGSRVGVGRTREQRIERANRLLDEYLLPHLGTDSSEETRFKKAIFIAQMINKLIELMLERRGPDDKDHARNKRLKLAGDMFSQLFRFVMTTVYTKEVKQSLLKILSRNKRFELRDLKTLFKQGMLSDKISHAMATGNWPGGRTGVTQILDRTNILSTLSHLRRVVSPLARTQPHIAARELHPSQWGRICPFETPEGQNIGLVKNLALQAQVSVGVPEEIVEKFLYRLGVKPIVEILEEARVKIREGSSLEEYSGWCRVYLNGRLIGYHPDGRELAELIRKKRRNIGRNEEWLLEVNVAYIESKYLKEVFVNCDAGRIRRPLIVVENGKIKLSKEHVNAIRKGRLKFSDLVKKGIIEFLDADEEENAYIALKPEDVTPEHTHVEIFLPSIFSITSCIIPYAEHNQSPRNTYEAAMAKQSLGVYLANFQLRMDSRGHLLHYPQKPLVQTKFLDIIGYNDRPAGQNMIVAILTFTGYNIEDALVMNRSSVDRGLGRSTFFRLYSTTEYRYSGGEEDKLTIPTSDVRGYKGPSAYQKLDPADGLANPEVYVEGGEVIIGKISPPRFLGVQEQAIGAPMIRQDTSVAIRYSEKGIVDTVMITTDSECNRLVKVRVRDLRIPELGDKFASRHGQKGVIGLLVPEYDMPFTEDGITPDLVINPHAFPSRMTVGQLLESVAGKAAALEYGFVDATPFYHEPIDKVAVVLKKHGYSETGEEAMYDGRTGEILRSPVFIGIVYYQKLHHMVSDKIHARATGPVQVLTRQPTEGRSKQGGLRWGEMEVDCLVGHGASVLLKEAMYDRSDKAEFYVCSKCGMIGYYDSIRGVYVCPLCKESGILKSVRMSYAFKLLLQELMSLAIAPRLVIRDIRIGDTPLANQIVGIKFGIFDPEEIRRMSVTTIVTSEVYDADGVPIDGGLADRRLGVIEPGEKCPVCGNTKDSCPGHFGHIELAKPVIHVLFAKHILMYLKTTCRECGRIKLAEEERRKILRLLEELKELKLYSLIRRLHEYVRREASSRTVCPHCGALQYKVRLEKPHTFYEEIITPVEGEKSVKKSLTRLTPAEVRGRLEKIPADDVKLLGGDPDYAHPSRMVLTVLPVPPRAVRPSILLEVGIRSEDDLTHKLVDIVKTNSSLRKHIEDGAPSVIINDEWDLLQYHITTYFDNEAPGVAVSKHRSGKTLKGIAQRLKGKEGRFRGNLRGKRVDYSARTVITPDPNISINEVGVPEFIAKILTVPERVTWWNIEELRKLVINGPDKWPGANYVIKPDGKRVSLKYVDRRKIAEALSPGWIVERHLRDGDIVLFNRQPSLHRISVMAHVVKVLPYKTFRLNLLVCPPYNADFDGDEMNLHVPQTEEARAEARILMMVEKHIMTPRYGGPIIGGLQDYISGAFLLTIKSTLLTLEDVVDLLAVAKYRGELPEPVILKPRRYWTGKQLISLFLPRDFTYRKPSKIASAPALRCIDEDCPHDSLVIIKKGVLLEGVLDKSSIGREEPESIVHWLIKEYGEDYGRMFMDNVYKMFLRYIEKHGLTLGYTHLKLPVEAKKKLRDIVMKKMREVDELIARYNRGELEPLPGKTIDETLEDLIVDTLSKKLLDEVGDIIVPYFSLENPVIIMARTGARGNPINLTQMAAMLGQQTVGGKRITKGYLNRVLPHFIPGDLRPYAHGFIDKGFVDGLSAIDTFIHAAGGREGLIDTAVKTSQSGYMQRRLINALQDLIIHYDGSVRSITGEVIQILFGEDGVDPAKSDHGKPVNIDRLVYRITR